MFDQAFLIAYLVALALVQLPKGKACRSIATVDFERTEVPVLHGAIQVQVVQATSSRIHYIFG